MSKASLVKAVSILCMSAAEAQACDAMSQQLDRAIERALQDARLVGAVVMVARDGQRVYARAAGWADREARRPMAQDAVFLLASVTKPIVTAATLRLAEQGKINLDDPVTRWLPTFRPRLSGQHINDAPPITVRQLLTHSAGLSYDFLESDDGPYRRSSISNGLDDVRVDMTEQMERIASAPLAYSPGQGWRYSVALDVIGAMLERVTQQSLPQIVEELVTGPLTMADTAFTVAAPERLAVPYADNEPAPRRLASVDVVPFNGMGVRFAPERWKNRSVFASGGAGLNGTATDILTFLEALRTHRLLARDTVELMHTPFVGADAQTQGPGWGFGLGGAVLVDPAAAHSPQSVGTLQWGGAYGHNWFIDPGSRLTVVALTNTTFEDMVGEFTRDVRDAAYACVS